MKLIFLVPPAKSAFVFAPFRQDVAFSMFRRRKGASLITQNFLKSPTLCIVEPSLCQFLSFVNVKKILYFCANYRNRSYLCCIVHSAVYFLLPPAQNNHQNAQLMTKAVLALSNCFTTFVVSFLFPIW